MREVQVSFSGPGGKLSGTLALPDGEAPHAAVLLLPGSGPIDRDADHRRLKLGISRDLARALAAGGVASLRYDKRGVGGSDGNFLATGMSDNIADGDAALAWLREQPQVRPDALFVLGHSEGALGAMAIAAGCDEADTASGLAGVVLLSPSATVGERMLAWQTRQVADTLPAGVRRLLRLLRVDLVRKQQANVARLRASTTDVVRMGGRRVNARWHRELLDFDPAPFLGRLTMPVLALTGAKDLQVDPDDLRLVERLVPGPVQTHRVPDLTHILRRDAKPPSLSAYRKLVKQPVDAEVLATVVDWVRTTARLNARPSP